MPEHLFRKFLLGLVGAVIISAGISFYSTTQATTTFFYSVTELGILDGNGSVAYDWGQIVGSGQKDGQTKAFLLTPVLVTN